MTIDGRKIPRLAVAVLVLGGACGDESQPSEDDAAARDAAAGEERDAGENEDVSQEPSTEPSTEAGAPPAPDATMPDEGIDTTDERLLRIARDFCQTAFGCDSEQAETVFDTETSCQAQVEAFWREDIEIGGEECGDAQLDLYACYATASCDEQFSACLAQSDASVEQCPEELQGTLEDGT